MDINWEQTFLSPVLILSLFTTGFMVYYFLSLSTKIREIFIKKIGEEETSIWWVIFQKIGGFVFLGIIPAIVTMIVLDTSLKDYGVKFVNFDKSIYWILGLTIVIIFMNYFAARKPESLKMYPQIRIRKWTAGTLALSSSGWFLYLLGYEFMFRGLLLFGLIPVIGVWPAIALNIAFYVFAHIPKGLKESIGSIPLGLILCIITIKTGTIWVAFFAHVALALSNQFFSIKYHPDMKFVTRKEKKSEIKNQLE